VNFGRTYKLFSIKNKAPMNNLYRTSLALLTDFYQITMAYGYWKNQIHQKQAIFNLYFRQNPFMGGFTVSAGLEPALEYLSSMRFEREDIDFLANLEKPKFEDGFLRFLEQFRFTPKVWAIPEGTVVFPNEPLLRLEGELWQCQLVESALLNIINFQTLIATKAARVRLAAGSDPVLEFGMRRGQGIDGAISASRAAYIGGADATSNVLAAKLYDIPIRGTHAHSWVMSFENEQHAFDAYCEAMPENTTLLVDTFDTLQGVDEAILAGKKLRKLGFDLQGIRLDSGDLAYLSLEARKKLDAAGFEKTKIVASNDLDENIILSLKTQQDARIDIWGVGTKLTTAFDQPALGGVYKLTALKEGENWIPKIKVSEQLAKITIPGKLQVRRVMKGGEFLADMIYDELSPSSPSSLMIDPADSIRRKNIEGETHDLLIRVMEDGQILHKTDISQIKENCKKQIAALHPSIKRFTNPHIYPVGLEKSLFEKRNQLIIEHKKL
jgi:nicotinate phosphoribosyltransferase